MAGLIISGKCEWCWRENGGEGCDWAMCGCACHDDDDWPDDEEVSDVSLGAHAGNPAADYRYSHYDPA